MFSKNIETHIKNISNNLTKLTNLRKEEKISFHESEISRIKNSYDGSDEIEVHVQNIVNNLNKLIELRN